MLHFSEGHKGGRGVRNGRGSYRGLGGRQRRGGSQHRGGHIGQPGLQASVSNTWTRDTHNLASGSSLGGHTPAPEGDKPTEQQNTSLDWSAPPCAADIQPSDHAAVHAYVERWGPLVQAELDAAKLAHDERLSRWPLHRLQSEGLVLMGVAAKVTGNYFGKLIITLVSGDGREFPFHKFCSGDIVILSRNNPITDKGVREAVVIDKTRYQIRAVTGRLPNQLDIGVWRVDCGINIVSFQRSAAALRSLYKSAAMYPSAGRPGALPPFPAVPANQQGGERGSWGPADATGGQGEGGRGGGGGGSRGRGRGRQNGPGRKRQRKVEEGRDGDDLPPGTCRWGMLVADPQDAGSRHLLIQGSPNLPSLAAAWASEQSQRAAGASCGGEGTGDAGTSCDEDVILHPLTGMNSSQASAIALAMQHQVSLLQGPPGTGKTTTIVRFLQMLCREFGFRLPILACAQSNVAVDNLLEGLMDSGVKALRVGQPYMVRESLRDATVDVRLLAHPLQSQISEAAQQLQAIKGAMQGGSLKGRDIGLAHRDVTMCKKNLTAMRAQVAADVLRDAQVICATCVGAGSDLLQEMFFPLVVLDEGSQCSEPESLIPLTRGSSHIVLVGDHCQLPPVVLCSSAGAGGLSTSLFERLMKLGFASAMLKVQYRMHPSLSIFPNREFYSGQLVDGVTANQRDCPAGNIFQRGRPAVVFVDVQDGRETVMAGGSKSNREEALVVMRMLQHLRDRGEPMQDIGFVTPYTAQVQLMKSMLYESTCASPYASWGHQPQIPSSNSRFEELEVKTVDGYQGREKDIIVFSCVRSNQQSMVGFLEDWRRLNVGITRARRGLIVVGHASTLRKSGGVWQRYMQWLEDMKVVVSAKEVLMKMKCS